MKHKASITLITACIFMISKPSESVAQKGSWLAEGNVGNFYVSDNRQVESQPNNVYKSNTNSVYFSIYPRIGCFINEHLVIGATVNFDYRRDRFRDYSDHGIQISDNLYKSAIVSLAPFARYYFNIASKNRFYAQLGAGAGTSLFYNETFTGYYNTGVISMTGKTTTTLNQFTGEALVGFNHFFTEHVAFNTAIGYQYVQRAQRATENYIYNGVPTTYQDKATNKIGKLVWTLGFTMIIPSKKKQ